MLIRSLVLPLLLMATTQTALAECGTIPAQPAAFDVSQVTTDQLPALQTQREAHHNVLSGYESCIEGEITALELPAVNGQPVAESSPEAQAYQSQFDLLTQQLELVAQERETLDNKFITLSNTATSAVQ